jgi:hypothetical protein
MPANSLGHFVYKTMFTIDVCYQGLVFKRGGTSPSSSCQRANQGTPQASKIPKLVRFQEDVVEQVLRIPAKSPFKCLILETPLWPYSCLRMSSGAKSPLEGLKALECKKGKLGAQPPIPYIPSTN